MTAADMKMKLAGETSGMLGIMLLNLGKQTGLWTAMAGGQKYTTKELADKSGLSERYLEEWCRAAALHGYLELEFTKGGDAGKEWDSGIQIRGVERYSMSSGMEEVLLDVTSPNYYGHSLSLPMLLSGQSFTDLVTAFKDDTGVPYTSYGQQFVDFVETSHSRMYQTQAKEWLHNPALSDIISRLKSEGGVVLDLGCGNGMSSISVAEALPGVTVHAVDCDEASMLKARRHIATAEKGGRVSPGQVVGHQCLAHEANIEAGRVDMVMVWIALHDMHNPSHVLETVRSMLRPDGCVLVLEFTNEDDFSALVSGDNAAQKGLTKFCLSVSVLHCLPVAKALEPSQAIGTAFSLATMQSVAGRAGFSNVSFFKANETMTMFILKMK